ncbi:MAG: ATP-binding protein, partial [Dehalococcoidia bacterium]|nr:ATP-binding protein [Dehalococcoidia bacterium]
MKLTRLAIRRLGTLVNVDLEPLGDLVVLVGRNGTGKSNVFEGLRLFFSEFQATGGESSAQGAEYLWHIRDTSKPIEIDVSIALSDNDLRGLQKALQDAGYAPQRDHPSIEATRALEYEKGWRTVRLSAFGAVLVENDAVS